MKLLALSVLATLCSLAQSDGGAMYTRWGRRDCPEDSKLVYKGYAGSSTYQEQGGSSNLLCLPEEPIYNETTPGLQGSSYIYSVEYESEQTKPNVARLNDHDMPCAVCLVKFRTTMMVPARNACFPGWRLEYWGYLWGGEVSYSPLEYICVDNNAVSAGDNPRGLKKGSMYVVESVCDTEGPLPCPPYQTGGELTCAVCTHVLFA